MENEWFEVKPPESKKLFEASEKLDTKTVQERLSKTHAMFLALESKLDKKKKTSSNVTATGSQSNR